VQISAKKQAIIAIVVALLTLAAKGSVALPMGVPPEVGAYITSWSNFLLALYAVAGAPIMALFSSSEPGLLAPPDSPAVKAAMTIDAANAAKSSPLH
jgi:hypothetical protein